MRKTRIICIATMIAFAGAGQASAGGLLGILSGNKTTGVGGIVIAPSVDVGDVLSNNKNNKTNVLNNVLSGNLNGILSGNNTGIGILNSGGGKKRH